jgi:transposase InsO family protein
VRRFGKVSDQSSATTHQTNAKTTCRIADTHTQGKKALAFPSRAKESAIRSSSATTNLVRLLPKAECLNGEIFYTLQEAKILIEAWRRQYNTIRPHSSLGYRPPAPKVLMWPAPPAALNGALPATSKPAQMPCN